MGKNVGFKELEEFQKRVKQELTGVGRDSFMESCVKDLAGEVQRRTVEKTPVRIGILRRGWKIENPRGRGSEYTLDIVNHVEYAPYVEYGHRTKGGKGWVRGKYMLTKSLLEVAAAVPRVLNKKLDRKLRRIAGYDK